MPDQDYSTDIRSLNDRMAALERELNNIQTTLIQIQESFVAVTKPRGGIIVFADGTEWDPGSGRGLYAYNDNTSAYVQIVALP
jgi:hypothetical protein